MTTKKKTKRAKKSQALSPTRRTGDKIASLAGRVMADLREARNERGGTKKTAADFVTLGELWAMAASCLSQGEQRGRRR